MKPSIVHASTFTRPQQRDLFPPDDETSQATTSTSFLEPLQAGCGCIPLGTRGSIAQAMTRNIPEGYVSLMDGHKLYKNAIKTSYESTFLPSGKRDFDRLSSFITELTEALGEGENKKNHILEGLKGHPQAQVESLLAAYYYLNRSLQALYLRQRTNETNSIREIKRYYSDVRKSLKSLVGNHSLIDTKELLLMVKEVRYSEYNNVRHLIARGANKVALALWISREKAKKIK